MIRKFDISDANFCADIFSQTLDVWTESEIKKSAESNGFLGFVDEEDGKIVAVGLFSFIFEEAEILNIATDKDYKRQKRAENILFTAFNQLKENGVKKVFLEVRESNAPAISLYNKLGFERFFERKNYYGNETALILKKEF